MVSNLLITGFGTRRKVGTLLSPPTRNAVVLGAGLSDTSCIGLIRTWNYDTGINKFEDLPGVPIPEKFDLLKGLIQALDLIPWNGKLHWEPDPRSIEQGCDNGFPDYALEANTFVVARDAYLQADWGGDGPQWDPNAFQMSILLAARGRWDARMAAIDRRYGDSEIDFDDFRRAQHEAAIAMAGEEAYV